MEWDQEESGAEAGDLSIADACSGVPIINDLVKLPSRVIFKCFSRCDPDVDTSRCGAADSDYVVWKRRRMESDTGTSLQIPIPVSCSRSLHACRDRQFETLKWMNACRSTISLDTLLARFDEDRRVGVLPSLACMNLAIRIVAERECHFTAVLDLLDCFSVDCGGDLRPSTVVAAIDALLVVDGGLVSAARLAAAWHSVALPPSMYHLICDRLATELQAQPSRSVAAVLCWMFAKRSAAADQSNPGRRGGPHSHSPLDYTRLLTALRCALPHGLAMTCAELFIQHHKNIAASRQRLPLATDTANSLILALCVAPADGADAEPDEELRARRLLELVKVCAESKLRLSGTSYEALIAHAASRGCWRAFVYLASMVVRRLVNPAALASACRLIIGTTDVDTRSSLLYDAKMIFHEEPSAYVLRVLAANAREMFTSAHSTWMEGMLQSVAQLCVLENNFRAAVDLALLCRSHAQDLRESVCSVLATMPGCATAQRNTDTTAEDRLGQLGDEHAVACFMPPGAGRDACTSHLAAQPLFSAARDGSSAVMFSAGPQAPQFSKALKTQVPRSDTYVILADMSLLVQVATKPEVQAAITSLLTKYDGTAAGAWLLVPTDTLAAVYKATSLAPAQKQAVFALLERWLLRATRWLHFVPLTYVFEAQFHAQNSPPGSCVDSATRTLCSLMAMAQLVHKKVALMTASESTQQFAKEVCALEPIIVLGELMKKLAPAS
jgi:hypothetical protein